MLGWFKKKGPAILQSFWPVFLEMETKEEIGHMRLNADPSFISLKHSRFFFYCTRHWKLSSIIARPDLKIIFTIISRRHLTVTSQIAGRGSSIGCASAWYADGRGFDPQVRRTFFRGDLVMKKILRPFSPFRWFKKAVVSYWRKNVH